jgi:hypothetical protein
MKRIIIFFVLFSLLYVSCSTGSGPWGKNKSKDTLSVHSVSFEDLLEKAMDSAEHMAFLRDYCVSRLHAHKHEKQFITKAIFDGSNASIQFHQGHLCSDKKQHAIVRIDNENLFFFFSKKDTTWQLKQVFNGYGVIKDSAVQFQDINFDGYKDLSILWNYSAGSCSCASPGCRDVYLYDSVGDRLLHLPEIRNYLEFSVAENERAIYLGEHCKGFYGRFAWNNGRLQLEEEYLTNEGSGRDTVQFIVEHNIYCDGQKFPAYTIPHLPLPGSWQQQFGRVNPVYD